MHDTDYKHTSHEEILRIVLMYAVFACLWILLSDWLLELLISDMAFLRVAQTLKGWMFVGVTALLLFFLLSSRRKEQRPAITAVRHTGLVDWPRWQLYLFAVAMSVLMILIRQNIAVSFDDHPLLVLFMFPIILSAVLGGFGPGIVATLLLAGMVTWFAIPPIGSFSIEVAGNLYQLGFLVGNGLLVSFLSRLLHDARHRAEIEKRNAQQNLKEKDHALQLLAGIAQGSSDAIFAKDTEDRFILFNPACEHYTGKKASEVLGRDETVLFPPDIAAKVIADNRKVMESNKTITFRDEIVTVHGKRTFLDIKGPLHDEDGKVIGMFGIARDISSIIATKEALRRERDRNQRYLDSVQNIMIALDSESRVTMINRYGCELLGYRESELIGQKWFKLYLPQPQGMEVVFPLFQQIIAGNLQAAEYFENEVVCRDGSRRLIAWHNGYFKNEAGNIVGTLSSGEDITERKRAEDALLKAAAFDEAALKSLGEGLYTIDDQGLVTYMNPAAEELFGWRFDELCGKKMHDMTHHHHRDGSPFPASDCAGFKVLTSGKPLKNFEDVFIRKDGTFFDVAYSIAPLHNGSDRIHGLVVVFSDITERKQAEDRIRKLSQAVEQSPESILITDTAGEIEYVNEAFVHNTGYSREDILGQNPSVLQSGKTPRSTYEAMWKNLGEGRVWQGELCNKRKDGSEYTEQAIISPIFQPDGQVSHYVSVQEDITRRKLDEAEIHRLAFYDTLTDLPNRALLLVRMEQTLSLSHRDNHHSALILLNIDRFKTINDAGGQTLGDALLKALGERIGGLLREGDVLARISGDEFAILLPDFSAEQHGAAHQSMHVAEKIKASMRQPFELGDNEHTVSVSIGIALFPENDADTPLDILRRSNTALHFAKSKGTGQIAFFESDLDEIARQRFDIERELRRGIEIGELRLYLQPQVDAAGTMVGAEALLRWQHPQRGLLPPMAFIPIAEESDLIVGIGEWVFTEVCCLLVHHDVQRPMRIAINISPRHFRQPDFVDWIKRGLAESGADPTLLTLEITEGMVINNIIDVIAKMNELSAIGIHFSMDDFGTGYSSLSYLKRLPINELKIDKTFVQDLTTDMEDAALVEAILAVAKLMHLNVVAEGVETMEQAAFLNERATVIHQGYLFGRPEPAEDLFKRISAQ